MILEHGNMWSILGETDGFCITTNSNVRTDGALVMGRGIAREARDRFPDLAYKAGAWILEHCGSNGKYGLLNMGKFGTNACILLFQVKYLWSDNADLELIKNATRELKATAEKYPQKRFDLNYPGIGNGKLQLRNVQPLLETLPDNVHVWRFV